MTLALRTRPLPRPLPGTAPQARTPSAEWVRYAAAGRYMYQLERGQSLLGRVIVDDDQVTEWRISPGRLFKSKPEMSPARRSLLAGISDDELRALRFLRKNPDITFSDAACLAQSYKQGFRP